MLPGAHARLVALTLCHHPAGCGCGCGPFQAREQLQKVLPRVQVHSLREQLLRAEEHAASSRHMLSILRAGHPPEQHHRHPLLLQPAPKQPQGVQCPERVTTNDAEVGLDHQQRQSTWDFILAEVPLQASLTARLQFWALPSMFGRRSSGSTLQFLGTASDICQEILRQHTAIFGIFPDV